MVKRTEAQKAAFDGSPPREAPRSAARRTDRERRAGRLRPLLALAAFLICAELVALAYFALVEDRIFYLEGRPLTRWDLPEGAGAVAGRLHPYFGFIAPPSEALEAPLPLEDAADWRPNHHGFLSASGDYPTAEDASRRYVGIFGGSVALQCALYLSEDPGFLAALEGLPGFADREVVVLNFAQPGYKQPQQLLVLGYFLALGQRLDLVINIDGFNELALAQRNVEVYGIDPSLPTGGHLSQLIYLTHQARLDAAELETLLAQRRVSEQRRRVAAWHDAAPSAALAFLLNRAHGLLDRRRAALGARLERAAEDALAGSVLALPPADPALDAAGAARTEAEIWASSSLRMHRLLEAEGIPYLHLLQPNQYHGRRRFSDAEAAIALSPDQPYRAAAERGYPRLVAAIPDLRAAGVRVIDGVDAFDDEPRRVYADDCCHYNRRGLAIIAERLARELRELGASAALNVPTR